MNTLIVSLLITHSASDAVPFLALEAEIVEQSIAQGVDPVLITQVIMIESRGRALAYNKRTHDYGLMQVNIKTAKGLGVSEMCLMNWKCNLRVGVGVLATILRHKRGRPCAYNLGIKGANKPSNKTLCVTYENKLYSFNN